MITHIVPIGNSQGIRIPKFLLAESGLKKTVDLRVKKEEIRITPARHKPIKTTLLLSEKTLARDWDRQEEDDAWRDLQ